MKNLNILLFILFALFNLFGFSSKIVFGHGLGDVFYLGISAAAFLVMLCIFLIIAYKKRKEAQNAVALFTFIILLSLCLKATIFRGPEYPWQNHQIFYR